MNITAKIAIIGKVSKKGTQIEGIVLPQELTPILKPQQARHQKDNCGHNHHDAVL